MKIMFSAQQHHLLLMISIFALSHASLALTKQQLSQEELYELKNNKDEIYLYCAKDRSKMALVIAEISKFDKDKNSPVCELNEHIERGFLIGKQDAIEQALEYAEEVLQKNYQNLNVNQVVQLQTNINSILNAISDGKLTVDVQSILIKQDPEDSIDQDDATLRSPKIKVREKLYALESAKFFKNVEFKDNVTINGSLSANDETINCNLSVGCNINMNNSNDDSVGNIFKNDVSFIHNFGPDNTFVGLDAGNFTMTSTDNTAVGYSALHLNTTGYYNTAHGSYALNSNTTGTYNTASGFAALASNVEGTVNTAHGALALVANLSGEANCAIGFISMTSNIEGSGNTAVGIASLLNNFDGDDNTAVGSGALSNNIHGNENTAIGENALASSTGSNNVALGINAGQSLTTGNNNIYIASNSNSATESGQIRIGVYNTHTSAYVQGIYTSGIIGVPVEVNITGQLGVASSSAQFKRNIKNMDINSEDIYRLRPVTFEYKNDDANAMQYGLIAEEVADVFPSLVVHDKEGNPYTVRYQVLPMLLLNEVQKHQTNIDRQQADIDALAERVAQLEEDKCSC